MVETRSMIGLLAARVRRGVMHKRGKMIETRAMIAGVLLLPHDAMMEGLESLALEPAVDKAGALYLCESDDDGGLRVEITDTGEGRCFAVGKRGATCKVEALALGEMLAARLDVQMGRKVFRGHALHLWVMGHPLRILTHERHGRVDGVTVEAPRWMEVLSAREARRAGLVGAGEGEGLCEGLEGEG